MLRRIPFTLARLLFFSEVVLHITWYGILWAGMVTRPGVLKTADFSIFYTAGRIAASGHYNLVFNIQAQVEVQEELLGHPLQTSKFLPFNHPPLLVPILQLVSTQDYMASYWRWVFVMLCFVAATMMIINQLLRAMQWDSGSRGLIILCSVLFYPIFVGLLKGQDTALLLFGAMLWVYGVVTKKDAVAGLGLVMTVIRPQIALVLAVPFLFNRRRVWWWFCSGAAFLGLYSLALVGFDGARDFISLLRISASGEGFGMNQNTMFNFTGLALRLFPHAYFDTVHIAAWGLLLAAVIGLSVWWKVSPEISYRHIVLTVTLSLFAAPHLHYHDLALLAVPIVGLGIAGVAAGRLTAPRAAALPMAVSVILLFSEFWDPARFTVPYLLMVVLPALTWWYETR